MDHAVYISAWSNKLVKYPRLPVPRQPGHSMTTTQPPWWAPLTKAAHRRPKPSRRASNLSDAVGHSALSHTQGDQIAISCARSPLSLATC